MNEDENSVDLKAKQILIETIKQLLFSFACLFTQKEGKRKKEEEKTILLEFNSYSSGTL